MQHFNFRVFHVQLGFEDLEVRPRFRSPRYRAEPFVQPNFEQEGEALDKDVDRVVDLKVVEGEVEHLERPELADKRREGAEAAAAEVEHSQGL